MPIWSAILDQFGVSSSENPSGKSLFSADIFALDDYAFIRVSGADTEKFLQGQSTCDFRRIAQRDFLLGAHCNAKGRMISSFIASPYGADILLRVHRSIADIALAALKKYSVFSKVKLELSDDIEAVALGGEGMVAAIAMALNSSVLEVGKCLENGGVEILVLADSLIELRGTASEIIPLIAKLRDHLVLRPGSVWDLELIRRGWAEVRIQTTEEYIPQMFNFDAVDGISFKKGCYTGQEIVARMQYLGKLKKHLYLGCISQAVDLPIGSSLRIPAAADAQGEVIMQAMVDGKTEFLAVVNDAAIGTDAIFCELLPEAKVAWLQLPYAIPKGN